MWKNQGRNIDFSQIDFLLYTDGAFAPSLDIGAWAFLLIDRSCYAVSRGGVLPGGATSNRAELAAMINGLDYIFQAASSSSIVVVSDSQYAVSAAKSGQGGKNRDLITDLLRTKMMHKSASFVWVKGHDGNPGNEYCDKLADLVVREAKRNAGQRIPTSRWQKVSNQLPIRRESSGVDESLLLHFLEQKSKGMGRRRRCDVVGIHPLESSLDNR